MPDICTLRPMTDADLPMLALWLDTPAAREWWGAPDAQLALITEDLPNPLMDQRIACLNAVPFGYLQSYPTAAWPAPHLADFPPDTRAVDCFIGLPALLNQGHGATMLRLYALHLRAEGCPDVLIDPDPANLRAIRSYRRAGFRDVGIRTDSDGDPCLVMQFDPIICP